MAKTFDVWPAIAVDAYQGGDCDVFWDTTDNEAEGEGWVVFEPPNTTHAAGANQAYDTAEDAFDAAQTLAQLFPGAVARAWGSFDPEYGDEDPEKKFEDVTPEKPTPAVHPGAQPAPVRHLYYVFHESDYGDDFSLFVWAETMEEARVLWHDWLAGQATDGDFLPDKPKRMYRLPRLIGGRSRTISWHGPSPTDCVEVKP